jgi:hypothetical protein
MIHPGPIGPILSDSHLRINSAHGSAGILAGKRISASHEEARQSFRNFLGVEQYACNTTNNL